ncbi:MAG: SGNH/GDSL hydrolase family protein [Halobacteriaceae archaeon]
MHHDRLSFHNVAELHDDDASGLRLQRVPEDVRVDLNEGARRRMCHPAGCELRFVADGPVEVTLSAPLRESPVEVFWGPFQAREDHRVSADPTTLRVEPPEWLGDLDREAVGDFAFDPAVCRLALAGEHRGSPIRYHGANGERRPPRADELPDRRYLAYGTSITEGEAATAEHLTYVSQTARRLGADLVNLGSCGTAYCDAAMADHVADAEWDVATLALSVNMVGEFSVAEFRERAAYLVETVGETGRPVACVTLYPYYDDLRESADGSEAARFREALREVVADAGRENVHLLEGRDLLDPAGLTTDLIHPSDRGFVAMGERLAARLDPFLD